MVLASDGVVFFFIIGIVVFVVAMIVLGARHNRVVRETWQQFASRYKLKFMGTTYGGISGYFGSAEIRIHTITRGSGKNRSTYTQFHATIPVPMPDGLVLYKEGLFSRLGKMLGGHDVQVGDPEIDNAFIIKANDLLGTHRLLTVPHVKKALLYIVARHPGMRLEARTVMWEETGTVSKLERLEANANDLSYLVGTLAAAHHELAAKAPAEQPRAAARAEILSVSTAADARVRAAAADEDPATRQAAFAEVATVVHALEKKMDEGEPSKAAIDLNRAFEDPHLNDELESAVMTGADALKDYDPSRGMSEETSEAFTNPEAEQAFTNPEPVEETPQHEPAQQEQALTGSLEDLVALLADRKLMSRQREEIIERHATKSWPVETIIERIDRTFGFDLPANLRDGRTIEGTFKSEDWKVAVRFPATRNAELDKLKTGQTLKAAGKVSAWDDLFRRVTIDAD
jgi:hypothetical protein